MAVIFYSTHTDSASDTGMSDQDSIRPIINTDPVAPDATNRPTHNLRTRTDILKYRAGVTDIAVSAPVLICAEDVNHSAVDVGWDGPWDPSVGTSVPVLDTAGSPMALRNSGKIWLGTPLLVPANQINVYPANAVYPARPAYVDVTLNGVTLTFTTNAPANVGNYMRVRLNATLAAGAAPTVSWEGDDVDMAVQSTPASSPPAPLTTKKGTLYVQTRSDGTTTIADLKGALVASPDGYTFTLTSTSVDATAVGAGDTGYQRLRHGIDATNWYIAASVLDDFFETGLVNGTLTQDVVASSSPQAVTVSTVNFGNITPGFPLYVGTTVAGDFEKVIVVSKAGSSVTAVFTKPHTNGAPIKAAPNRLQKGDTLVLDIGDAKARLGVSNITKANLQLMRSYTSAQIDTPVIPICSCPNGASRLIWANAFSINAGEALLSSTAVQLAGDLAGPGSTLKVPRVVHANATTYGLVMLNASADGAEVQVPALTATGEVKGNGLTRATAAGALTIGTQANDTSVTLGRVSAALTVNSNTTFASTVAAPGLDTASAATLPIGATNASSVTIGKAGAAVTANGPLKAASLDTPSAGALTVGTTTATSVTIGSNSIPTSVLGGAITVGNASSTVTATGTIKTPIVDAAAAGAMKLGPSVASSVEIAKAGAPTTVKGSLSVAEDATVTGTVTGGALSTSGTLSAGNVVAGTVAATGNATVGGTLAVTGATTLAGATMTSAAVSGALTAGSETVSGNLSAGATTLTSVHVTGATNLDMDTSIGGSTSVGGNATVNGTLRVTGATTLTTVGTGALTASSLNVSGAASTGNLTAGNVNASGTLTGTTLTLSGGVFAGGDISAGTAGTATFFGKQMLIRGVSGASQAPGAYSEGGVLWWNTDTANDSRGLWITFPDGTTKRIAVV